MHETEGQVIFIQSVVGYPYNPFDMDFEAYLALAPDSPKLNITSSLAKTEILADLARLVEDVDNGSLSASQLLEGQGPDLETETIKVVNKLHVFTLLLQDQELVSEDEESFVRVFQGTFLGKQLPDQAPRVAGAFSHRGARAIQELIRPAERALFAQTGLKVSTCRKLMERVRSYWQGRSEVLGETLSGFLGYDTLYEIAKVIYDLDDEEVDPQSLLLTRGGRKLRRLEDDRAFFADWIVSHDSQALLNQHFNFINDPSWRAEQYVLYTQQTLGYRAPWTLSAFWLFSKSVVSEDYEVDLMEVPLGRELLLLPAYAKFGVNTPAAAL
ncbi:MAG: hypothetical protein MN733_23150, partial [Nitrososphaera sp.]|nr:hypothetical protein [Nitrososphaera sp.]